MRTPIECINYHPRENVKKSIGRHKRRDTIKFSSAVHWFDGLRNAMQVANQIIKFDGRPESIFVIILFTIHDGH